MTACVDVFDEIAALARELGERYRRRATIDAMTPSLPDCLTDPAARYVAAAVWAGQPVPINAATVAALRAAIDELDAH